MDTDCGAKRKAFLEDLASLMSKHGVELKLRSDGLNVELLYDLHSGFGCDYATDEYLATLNVNREEDSVVTLETIDEFIKRIGATND